MDDGEYVDEIAGCDVSRKQEKLDVKLVAGCCMAGCLRADIELDGAIGVLRSVENALHTVRCWVLKSDRVVERHLRLGT